MIYLALEHERSGCQPEDFNPFLISEAEAVWKLYLAGVLRQAFFRADQHTAVLILECTSIEEAKHMLANMPMAQAGLITFEIIPLMPYDGFARLFISNDLPERD